VREMFEGVECLRRMGQLLGVQNLLYRHAVDGISERMNTDIESMLQDEFQFECLVAEAMICRMQQGFYFEPGEIRQCFRHERWQRVLFEYAGKYECQMADARP